MSARLFFLLVLIGLSLPLPAAAPVPPPLPREFRGAWIATVANIDWPSRPGLPAARQQAELRAILDRAVALRLNAVIFQVRPAGDAFYESRLEPWSEYLTGTMGQSPGYDPLALAVAEARLRGLELHAWFNPFRVRHASAKSKPAANHISQTRPDLVRRHGEYIWLDPAEPVVQDRAIAVIRDVLRRYDVDGVHIDDYFYPYPVTDAQKRRVPFPDDTTWARYQRAGGTLSRDDWRRANVDRFVERLHREIKAEKSWVKFGISPFGIWRPGHPAGIRGLDAYGDIYADARKWMHNGWADYFAPQLYWPLSAKEQSLPALLDWWLGQNARDRHVWPGLNATLIGTTRATEPRPISAEEIVRQIATVRARKDAGGIVFWNTSVVRTNAALGSALQQRVFPGPALIPASPWLGAAMPGTPSVALARSGGQPMLDWKAAAGEPARWWAVQSRVGGRWVTEILPATQTRWLASDAGGAADWAAVTGVSRTGTAGRPKMVDLRPARTR